MKILFKYPTRSRPEMFKKAIHDHMNKLSGKHQWFWFITTDADDASMNTPQILDWINQALGDNYLIDVGIHKTKIDAYNSGEQQLKTLDYDILYSTSDDTPPEPQGFDDIVCQHMQQYFPNLDGALHYATGWSRDAELCTLPIMGKNLYLDMGYICHPDYKNEYADDEYTQVLKAKKKIQYFPNQVVYRHNWIGYNNGDKLIHENLAKGHQDRYVFLKRQLMGFPNLKGEPQIPE